jgi:hypothetical protein
MIMREGSMLIIIAILAGAAILSAVATKVFKLEDDNPIEQSIEDMVESYTGIDIDLSPGEDKDAHKCNRKENK